MSPDPRLTPCIGSHILREPLYRTWQVGLVCWSCGRRKRTREQMRKR